MTTTPDAAPVTRAEPRAPKPSNIKEPAFLFRQPITFISPSQLKGGQWRQLVGGAPIVKACIQTLIMQLTGFDWILVGDDENAKAYFTKLLENAGAEDGGGWEVFASRVAKDTLEVPFGGAAEIGSFSDGVVAWLTHVDAATMVPTYNPRFPYAQVDPFGTATIPVQFTRDQIGRVRWQAETDARTYGWTITPAQDCLPAIQGLLRADTFWQSFMSDSPPAGILDLPGFSELEAKDWLGSWKEMLGGIDALKVPVLYGGETEDKARAQYITFAKSPSETKMMELIKAYAEVVCACFGMTLGDLGLFGMELRLAGATKLIELSKRQGLAKLQRGLKSMIDLSVLPDGLEFEWSEIDTEDRLRQEQAKQIGSQRLKNLTDGFIISPKEARRVAVLEKIVPADAIDADVMDQFDDKPVKPKDPEDVDITDAEQDASSKPTGEGVADDLEQRARDLIQAFPLTSKWARAMQRIAEKLMRPAKQGFTKRRSERLLTVGIDAYTEGAVASDLQTRAIEDSRAALEKALATQDWWKSPDLVDEITEVLRGAYEEGALGQIEAMEIARLELGLPATQIATTTFNLTNEAVLGLLRERAGEFIQKIDDGTVNSIINSVLRGVREGIASPDIAREILANGSRRSLVETFRGRALSIVNTEINWAESQAAMDEMVQTGLRKKFWHSIPGIRCPICERNTNASPVGMDYDYESVFGTTQAPPAHPGVCHCYISFDKDELKALGDDPNYWLGV